MESCNLQDVLCDLIAINSINPNYTGNSSEGSLINYVAGLLDRHGIACRLDKVLPGRMNLVARLEGRTSTGLCFEAHADTVGVDHMTIDPFTPLVRDGLVYGRGSCDTKGSMAAMLQALINLKHSHHLPATDIYFVAAVDEEFQGQGARHLLAKGFQTGGAVIGEPTSLQLVTACKGVARFSLRTTGRAAHSAMPQAGENAISKMARLISAIEQELCPTFAKVPHPLLGSPTINVGLIKGGSAVNIVPDECSIEVDRRLLPSETFLTVTSEIQDLAEKHKLAIGQPELLLFETAMETAPDCALVRAFRQVMKSAGLEDEIHGVSYCCDGAKFSRAGIPSVIFGPGDIGQAHAACEFVPLHEVEQAAELYQRLCLQKEIG